MDARGERGLYVFLLLLIGAIGPWWLGVVCFLLIIIAYM